jgi:ABC transport system ATP-binding/permease protein
MNPSLPKPAARPPARPPRRAAVARNRRWRRWGAWLGRLGWRWRGPDQPVLQSNLADLIRVFAAFTRVDGQVDEDEVDSILGFLRYDYPESVYSELRRQYVAALRENQNLEAMAEALAARLAVEEKILLGVQLYVLASRSGLRDEAFTTFYRFMTALGMAGEAIDIVYQLNARGGPVAPPPDGMSSLLESLLLGAGADCDVRFEAMPADLRMAAFRFRNLILLKNVGDRPFVARGRTVPPGEFCRLFEGQQAVFGEVVLPYQDFGFYFNARKDLAIRVAYLGFGRERQVTVERKRSKQSVLEVRFGLNTEVIALRPGVARLRGGALEPGVPQRAALRDKLEFAVGGSILLGELRRRLRDMGVRIELVPDRTEYLVSNNPALLAQGDILLSPGAPGDILLRIQCDYEHRAGLLEVLEAPRPVLVENFPARPQHPLQDGATIALGEGQFLRCHFGDRIIEEERSLISRLEARDLSHSFERHEQALEAVSFEARRGEMICVMGPSGCGKSTLLRILAGQLRPSQGTVLLNGLPLDEKNPALRRFIAFMPHEEGFDPLLTIEENLTTAAAVRAPHISRRERQRRIEAKLAELGLKERRGRLPGLPGSKSLSHGERKRLNIGMDVIGIADVYLFDEPTSGLSSKDSEHVLEIIRGLAHNKIIIVSIHQPSARLFQMFHKALLLDHGGRLAFFGTPAAMLDYFNDAWAEEGTRAPGSGGSVPAALRRQPEFIFDVLETPLLDPAGEIIHEEDRRGRVRPARRFPPAYWRDRFQAHRVLQEVGRPVIRAENEEPSRPGRPPQAPSQGLAEEGVHLGAHFRRAFLSKLRNRANLATTLVEAPALAVLVALAMRYSEGGAYGFGGAFHIPTYLFLSLVVALFLGLTNSADEVIRDRAIIRRERNLQFRPTYYTAAKVATLSLFSVIQCVLYLVIGNRILGIRDMLHWHLLWMLAANLSGVVTGLFISSLVRDAKTALNLIPVVLVPQIILGGALIRYEEMNRDFDLPGSFTRWHAPGGDPPSDLRVPLVCEFMPLRWAYEGLFLAQARHNPLSRVLEQMDAETDHLKAIPPGEASAAQEARLELLKEARIPLIMLAEPSANAIADRIREFAAAYADGSLDPERFRRESVPATWIRARDVYWNEKTRLLFEKAEIERTDNRRALMPNVFFGSRKTYFGREWDTIELNLAVTAGFLLAGFAACVWRVRRLAVHG